MAGHPHADDNKIDLLSDKNQVLKKIADWAALHPFREIVRVSAGRDGS